MFVIKYRKIFFAISALLVGLSIFAMFYYGFNFGIDFKGGSLLEVSFSQDRPSSDIVNDGLKSLSLGSYSLQPSGNQNYILRTRELTQEEKNSIVSTLSGDGSYEVKEERFNTIGPIIGKELRTKALLAILVVIIGIVLFVTFAFRKVSEPVSSWKYGLATIIALAHDVIVPTGIFILFIRYHGGEIDVLFVSALLAILGYSVHDTIVVFDRVRENLHINKDFRKKENFEDTVGTSVGQTFGRSINTSLTIFIVLAALYFLGGESTRDFTFVLLVGVIAGTYSSIFLASPLLVTLEKLQYKTE